MECLIEIDPGAQRHSLTVRLTRDPRWGSAQWQAISNSMEASLRTFAYLSPVPAPSPPIHWHSPAGPEAVRTLALELDRVHPSLWRVLTGCLFGQGVLEVRVRDANGVRERLDWAALFALPRFYVESSPAFAVSILESPNGRDRLTAQWVFAGALNPALAQSVYGLIEDWNVLIAGGFPSAGGAPGSGYSGGVAPYQADHYTIEHQVIPWSSDQEALQVLIGLADQVHRSLAPLTELLIE